MTTVRKKKKHKNDVKASEQLRKWLSKENTPMKCSHSVTFETFSKLVENLSDIAFEIQATEISGQNKTLDECARWFYNAFYTDPIVRAKYEIQLRSCPLSIKEKLFQLPAGATTDGVEVTVTKCGRFLFPVTFSTFEKYIDKKKVLPTLLRSYVKSKEDYKAFYKDKTKCRTILQKYYNTFYIFPNRRKDKLRLNEAPPGLQALLLKPGVPLDDTAFKTANMYSNSPPTKSHRSPRTTKEQPKAVVPVVPQNPRTSKDQPKAVVPVVQSECVRIPCSISKIVSFAVFEKYIKNLYDIVWRLKLSDPEYVYKGFEDCAFAFYLDFYLAPAIRDRFPIELVPCTTAMKDRLFALPNPSDVKTLLHMKDHSQQLTTSSQESIINVDSAADDPFPITEKPVLESKGQLPFAEVEADKQTKTTEKEMSKGTEPVTFAQFKSLISNLHMIVDKMKTCGEYQGKSRDECAMEYYKAFYATPQIRERFPFTIKPCPAKMRVKLLTLPEKTSPTTQTASAVAANDNDNDIDIPNEEHLLTILGTTYVYAVTFETFMRYINYDELKEQLVKAHATIRDKLGDYPSDIQLFKRYYHSFYINNAVRKKFNFNFNAAPPKLLPRLMNMAIPLEQRNQESSNKVPAIVTTTSKGKAQKELEHEKQWDSGKQAEHVGQTKHAEQTEPQEQVDQEVPMDEQQKQTQLEDQCVSEEQRAHESQRDTVDQEDFDQKYEQHLEFVKQMELQEQRESDRHNGFEEQMEFEELIEFEQQAKQEHQIEYEQQTAFEEQMELVEQSEPKQQTEDDCETDVEDLIEVVDDSEPEEQSETQVQEECEKQTACEEALVDMNCSVDGTRKRNTVVVLKERILITVQGIQYEFPVSIQTFQRYINYDTLKVDLVKSFLKSNHQLERLLCDERSTLKLLRRYYNSFYTNESVRKKFNYNFHAAPPEMQEKLQQFAVPLHAAPNGNQVYATVESGVEVVPTSVSPVAAKPMASIEPADSVQEKTEINQSDDSFPVSFRVFSKILHLDEVVKQMQKEAQYARKSVNECKLAYFEAFYRTPAIRGKYVCTMRPCPAVLKAKILEIPRPIPTNDHNYSKSSLSDSNSTQALDDLYATRKAELARMKKNNVVNYVPHNLSSYIALRLKCPQKRLLLEEHFCARKTAQEIKMSIELQDTPVKESAATTVVAKNPANTVTVAAAKSTLPSASSVAPAAPKTVGKEGTAATTVVATNRPNTGTGAAAKTPLPSGSSGAYNTPKTVGKEVSIVKLTESALGVVTQIAATGNSTTCSLVSQTTPSASTHAEKRVTESKAKNPQVPLEPVSSTHAKLISEFFAPIDKEHNMVNLVYTSNGLSRNIWRVLSQLSYSEFKAYTGIYEGQPLYGDESILRRIYSHVIEHGNWPINLYVKLSKLNELLHSKAVYIEALNLAQLSPKIFHWRELSCFTNFDDIVECEFRKQENGKIHDLPHLLNEVEKFYAKCWTLNRWIQGVPQITDRQLTRPITHHESVPKMPTIIEVPIYSIRADVIPVDASPVESEVATNSLADNQQDGECPATQLEVSLGPPNFIDIESVCPATQLAESQSDPLMQSIHLPTVPMELVQVKQEPVKFLSSLRFTINSDCSLDYRCEHISKEEQIINLIAEDDDRITKELACFDITTPEVAAVPSLAFQQFQAALNEMNMSEDQVLTEQPQQSELSVESAKTLQSSGESESTASVPPMPAVPPPPVVTKRQNRATTSTVPCKKPRLMADNVPQLRHEFRPLPLAAVVRVETTGNPRREDNHQQELPTSSSQGSQSSAQMTASQAFATDNTLMESSQLQHLLDAPFVNQRQVNLIEPMEVDCVNVGSSDGNVRAIEPMEVDCVNGGSCDKNFRAVVDTRPVLHNHIVFSTLQRYMYFASLTTANIAKYQINRLAVGASYQQALIVANGKLCNVHGPLLENLFQHCTASVLKDLQSLLNNVGEFNYNCRMNLQRESEEDLRTRVIYAFMRAAPPFGHIRLTYENETREWANCSAIGKRDDSFIKRKPSCDVSCGINPEILERMKELKASLHL